MRSLGWALYNMNRATNLYDLDGEGWSFGVIHPKSNRLDPQYIWRDAFYQLKQQLGEQWPTHLVLEWPTFFSSARGRIAAMRGHTIDLAGLVGFLVGRFGLKVNRVTLWKPEQWKGSVPKRVTAAKFIRLFGPAAVTAVNTHPDDTVDAIMLAEHWLSLYERGKITK